jgi:pyruvate/2-oxoglutarate dehydrogenase complex dihydrolipoamide acyltransferase (E2) component
MDWVKTLKIDVHRVFAVLGVKGEDEIGIDQLEELTGLRTSIREGDQTVDDAFPVQEPTPTLGAEPVPTLGPDKALAAAGLTPVVPAKRGGRPVGSKNRPKENGAVPAVPTATLAVSPVNAAQAAVAVTTPPEAKNAPEANGGATAAIPDGDAPSTPQDVLADFCQTEGVSFDDFTDWSTSTGRLRDAKSYPDFDSLPGEFCRLLVADAAALSRCVQIFGHRPN